MKSSLLSYARWLIVKSLVDYGLLDAWRVRVENFEAVGTRSLNEFRAVQGNAEALLELTHGDESSRIKMAACPNYPHKIALLGVLFLVLGCIAIAFATWIFHANPMPMPQRLIWCICAALVVTVLLFGELWFASGSCLWIWYLSSRHKSAFRRGLLRGVLGGALFGLLYWNNAGSWSRGICLVGIGAAIGALGAGLCAAQADHENMPSPAGTLLRPGFGVTSLLRALLTAVLITIPILTF